MGNTHKNSGPDESTIWLAGLTPEDFLVPSPRTAIAEVASAVTNVAFEIASLDLGDGDAEVSASEETQDVFLQVLQAWGQPDDSESDLADRKVPWPQLALADLKPDASPEKRIEDNLSAIKLLRELKATQREVSNEDRKALLRYCGWGGLARVFSPDGSTPHKWATFRDELETLTSKEEFELMRASVTTAYYTAPEVAAALWAMVQRLGFKGGRILEPSAGVGHILATMPAEVAARSEITAVELDSVSAALLERGFGPIGVQVHASAIEKTRLPAAFYDLVIGNVPFGDFKSLDTSKAPYSDWSIHNYFLGKAVDLVRPGGLIALITSRHTMDSKTEGHRAWLAAHAELIGAFRLPTMAFKGQAGTEAVTDILLLRRREVPDYKAGGWVQRGRASDEMLKAGQSPYAGYGYSNPRDRSINAYYVAHPEHVVGLLQWERGQHGETLNPVFDGDEAALAQALERRTAVLPKDVYEEVKAHAGTAPQSGLVRYANDGYVSPGSFVFRDGRLCVSEGDELLDVDSLYTGTARKRVLGMLEIKKCLVEVIEHQARSNDDNELQRLQRVLNGCYDAFVAQYGYLSTNANSRLMRSDPNWPLMLACEIWDDEESKAKKADIFSKRTAGHRSVPQRVESVKDAMLVSLGLYGKIVLKDMALRTGMSAAKVVQALQDEGLAYRDPVLARWVTADEYLSGHIRDKIAAAQAAGPAYARNIAALQAVLPKDLGPAEVEARLGAPWIPSEVIRQFAIQLVNDTRNEIQVSYDAGSATWSLKGSYRMEYCGDHTLQHSKWGTPKRCALELLEGALNQTPPTVTEEIDGKRVVNRMATLAAREKWQAIKDHFRSWVYKDFARAEALLRIYNDQFNQIVVRKYDGSHLTLPGMSLLVTPYRHQLDAIWRIVCSGNTLLAHCVGAGKTLVMAAASMELKRLGRAAKPLHVVPNHCLEQYVAEFVRLYPQAKVLMASKDDLHGDSRRTFAARVAMGDWDAVVMTQATFERLPMAPEVQQAFLQAQMAEARLALQNATDSGAKRSLKEIERRMKDYEAKVERLMADEKKDQDSVWFDELGVDYLFLDEAHAYKRLQSMSKMPKMAGLPSGGSQRAFDVFMKTRHVMEKRGNDQTGVVMATATPISNTMAELHVFQRYLQPKTLRRMGLYEFDAWSASFGEGVTGIELAPDGGGYRVNTRYARFVNTPELMAIFREVADIRTKRMLKLPTPKIKGGKPQVLVTEQSEAQKAITAKLVERADKVRSGRVKPDEDNMLAVTNDGRKAALDARLVDRNLPFEPNGKLAMAADNMVRIWNESATIKGTQLVFSDLGTPGGATFDVYEEVKRLLVQKGVPAEQIEFIQHHDSDKAKAKLFQRVRDGLVRFLLGSTQKMGTGTNVQLRLKAVHQLDAPWVPSDVEQRDGRGDRQGNLNDELELWRYTTAGSFDAYSWNLLNVKANFIEQIMAGEAGVRCVEDISTTALTYAEIKAIASGNPLVMEKAGIDSEVQKLGLLRTQWEEDQYRLAWREKDLIERLGWIDRKMPEIEKDAAQAAAQLVTPNVRPLTAVARGALAQHEDGHLAIGVAFRAESRELKGGRGVRFVAVGGIEVEAYKFYDETRLQVVGPVSGVLVHVDRPAMTDAEGVGAAVMEAVQDLARMPAALREEYGRKTEELANVRDLRNAEFEHAARLEQLLNRQREIEAELDLDKDVAGTQAMGAEAA